MAKAKLEGPRKGTMQSLMGRMYADFGVQMTTGEEFSKTWRYLTFTDPKTGLPSIAHEWIVGAAGFRAGKFSVKETMITGGIPSAGYVPFCRTP